MKINLLINNPKGCRQGYLNIDPLAPMGAEAVKGDPTKLDDFVCENEATEILALEILDKFSPDKVDNILDHWLSRLAHKGRLTISVVDLYEIARGVVCESINVEIANNLLYGTNVKNNSAFTLDQLSMVLENKGYKVIKKFIENNRAYVTVERP